MPMFELLSGVINGVNQTFSFSRPYTPGTAVGLINGQVAFNSMGNPWAEFNPSTGEIMLTFAPIPGDEVSGFAIDTTPDVTTTAGADLILSLESSPQLDCVLASGEELALLEYSQQLDCVLTAESEQSLDCILLNSEELILLECTQ